MAYHAHDPTGSDHPGYHSEHGTPLFFEEDDNQYSSSKYDSNDDPFSGYKTGAGKDEDKKEEEMSEFEKHVDEHDKAKNKTSEDLDDEQIIKRAADELRLEDNGSKEEVHKKKKTKSSIEEAIDKAMKEEKEIVYLDNY